MEKIKFWEDSPGSQSSGRLVFLIGTLYNMVLTVLLVIITKFTNPLLVVAFFSGMQAVITTGKLVQNKQENNESKPNLDNNTSTAAV